ncbi:nuclear transport factor 2 family protein [Chitinophaga arvensicola]|uniref:Lumazine-binding n=1 Tax=Chitinophaga arvensicola TaxID=29529 RepID=A0A1I0R8Q5_9BACT|nr:hypothetical protein [Chitinophaga arvensicola]SEW36532.1 hypothetical protein SAMN04488122_2401 [Chitinophaga arvensicola]
MRPLFLSTLLLFGCANACAQTPETSAKAIVNQLFTAMRNSDSAGIVACFAPGASLKSVTEDKAGNTVVKDTPIPEFASVVGNLPANAADERIVFDNVLIDGNMASIWTPYRFFFKGQFSHCGVDAFLLVKLSNSWKILHILDTRRKENCIENK